MEATTATGTDWIGVVREVFPDATEDDAEFLLWNCTGFPGFWNIPRDGATSVDCARTQLRQARDYGVDAVMEHACNGGTPPWQAENEA